jgi:hypothetical protein
MFQRTNCSLHF